MMALEYQMKDLLLLCHAFKACESNLNQRKLKLIDVVFFVNKENTVIRHL